jgi:O-antigen/teichoic acid export membrane protein
MGIVYQAAHAFSLLAVLAIVARQVPREVYGLWLTVLTITTWTPLVALGQNAVVLTAVGAVARTDPAAVARAFGASFHVVLTMTVALVLLLLVAMPWAPWPVWLNASSAKAQTAASGVAVAGIAVSLAAVPFVLAGYVLHARQRGDIVHSAMTGGCLASVATVVGAVALGLPMWAIGAFAVSGPLIGGMWLVTRHVGGPLLPWPRWQSIDARSVRPAVVMGTQFVVIDLLTFAVVRTPELIVAQLHGVEQVAAFGSAGRLPMLVLAACQAVMLPYWPALSAAAVRGDRKWIRAILLRSLTLILAMGIAIGLLVATIGPAFIGLWLGDSQLVGHELLIAACAQSVGMSFLAWHLVVMGALSHQRASLGVLALTALAYGVTAWLLGSQWGPVGVAWAQAVALLCVAAPTGLWLLRRRLRASLTSADEAVAGPAP